MLAHDTLTSSGEFDVAARTALLRNDKATFNRKQLPALYALKCLYNGVETVKYGSESFVAAGSHESTRANCVKLRHHKCIVLHCTCIYWPTVRGECGGKWEVSKRLWTLPHTRRNWEIADWPNNFGRWNVAPQSRWVMRSIHSDLCHTLPRQVHRECCIACLVLTAMPIEQYVCY